jgi:hypothetical protein
MSYRAGLIQGKLRVRSRAAEGRPSADRNEPVDECVPGFALDRELDIKAGFNFGLFAANKCWVAGVELATASEPPARRPRIWGRRPSGVDPSHPLRCNLLLNFADINSSLRSFQQDMHS